MPVILPEHKLSYFFVPKVACTSLKYMFYEVENGKRFEPFRINGKLVKIHGLYPSPLFDDCPHAQMADHTRLALVRDPVERVLSCYGNRVVASKELSEAKAGKKLKELGLKPNPTLQEFIARLKRYRKAHRSIAHHSRPLSDFLGKNPDYFTRIYPLREIGSFVEEVSKIVGRPLEAERLQTRGPKFSPETDLTEEERAKIRRIYAEDYEIFGDRF